MSSKDEFGTGESPLPDFLGLELEMEKVRKV
jgi:hypothetical protein